MTNCKLLVYYPADLKIFTGSITDIDGISIKLNDTDATIFENAVHIKLKWYSDNLQLTSVVAYKAAHNGEFIFSQKSDISQEADYNHSIEFREFFEIAPVDITKMSEFKNRTNKLNNRFRSTLTTQIKKILTDETLTNQYIFKLLMQIDSKMDELLDSLKTDDNIENLEESQVLSLGGDGLAFISDKDMSVGDDIFVQSLPKNGVGLNFAALCKITDVINTENSNLYEADFDYVDENTKENIIHFIFQKERAQLRNRN